MSDRREVKVEVPKPGTEEQLKKAIEDKLKLISTELSVPKQDQVAVILKKNRT